MHLVAGIPPQHRPFLCWRAVSFVAVFCETFRVNVRGRRFDNATGGLGSTWDVRLVIPLSDLFAGLMEGRSGTRQDNQAESESDKRSEFSIQGLDSDEDDADPPGHPLVVRRPLRTPGAWALLPWERHFSTRDAAMTAVQGSCKAAVVIETTDGGHGRILVCRLHVGCGHHFKIAPVGALRNGDRVWGVWESTNPHAAELAHRARFYIHPVIMPVVDTALAAHTKLLAAITQLHASPEMQRHKTELNIDIPSEQALRHRKKTLSKGAKTRWCVATVADLKAVEQHYFFPPAEVALAVDRHKYFTVRTPTQTVRAYVFTNVTFAVNIKKFCDTAAAGHRWCIATDGTFKFVWSGWVVLSVGTKEMSYDAHNRQWRQSYRPFLFMLTPVESQGAYSCLFGSLQQFTFDAWGHNIQPAVLLIDKCPASRNAGLAVWPHIKVGTDFFHLTQNAKKHAAALIPAGSSFSWLDLRELLWTVHKCKTPQAAYVMAELVRRHLEKKHLAALVQYLYGPDSYFSETWFSWYVGFVDIPGITPSTQDLESFHKIMKTARSVVCASAHGGLPVARAILGVFRRYWGAYVSIDMLVETCFRAMLAALSDKYFIQGDIIRMQADAPSVHMVLKAARASAHIDVKRAGSRAPVYVNSKHEQGTSITPARIVALETALRGHHRAFQHEPKWELHGGLWRHSAVPVRLDIDAFRGALLGLHQVRDGACLCKSAKAGKSCSHIQLATRTAADLAAQASSVGSSRKRGRPPRSQTSFLAPDPPSVSGAE